MKDKELNEFLDAAIFCIQTAKDDKLPYSVMEDIKMAIDNLESGHSRLCELIMPDK